MVDERCGQLSLGHIVAPDLVNADDAIAERLKLVIGATRAPMARIHEKHARLVARYLWPTVHGPWCMAHDVWPMVHGPWYVTHGARPMVCGPWCMAHGMWPMVCGPWCMAHGAWPMVCGLPQLGAGAANLGEAPPVGLLTELRLLLELGAPLALRQPLEGVPHWVARPTTRPRCVATGAGGPAAPAAAADVAAVAVAVAAAVAAAAAAVIIVIVLLLGGLLRRCGVVIDIRNCTNQTKILKIGM